MLGDGNNIYNYYHTVNIFNYRTRVYDGKYVDNILKLSYKWF